MLAVFSYYSMPGPMSDTRETAVNKTNMGPAPWSP